MTACASTIREYQSDQPSRQPRRPRPPGAPPTHDERPVGVLDRSFHIRTRAPASFKRLLGRIRARASAPRRTNQAPHEPKNQAEGPGKENAQQRNLIGTRRDQNRAHEPDDEGDRAHEQSETYRTLTPPPPASDGAVAEDCPEGREWYEGYDQAHGVTRDCGMRPNGSRLSCGAWVGSSQKIGRATCRDGV